MNHDDPILFDLDGVLVDSRVPISRSINFALERHGLSQLPAADLYPFIGPPLHDAFTTLLDRLGASLALAEACVAVYRERYREACLTETTLVPGVVSVVEKLACRRRLAVATSKPTQYARPILETLGLAEAFQAIVGPPMTPRGEPKSETVHRALSSLGVTRGAIVGDRHHDVEAGRANGLLTVGVTWGIGSESELREAGADHVVHNPPTLLEFFS